MAGTHAWMAPHVSVIISINNTLFSVMLNPLHSSSCSKSSFVIKVSTMKISVTKGSHHVPTTKSTHFLLAKMNRDAKEDADKSMKNALYALWHAKRHPSSWSNVKQWKIKLIANKLCLSKGMLIRWSVSQSVENFVQ